MWKEDVFFWKGKYFSMPPRNVVPKPYQKPHPPLRIAATTQDTYAMVGRMGYPLFMAARSTAISDLRRFIGGYHQGWREAGHPGGGDVALLVPVYVAETARAAREEPEASTMHFIRSIARALQASPTAGLRGKDAARLARITYEEVLEDLVVYGTPEAVADRLLELREELGYASLSVWMNEGAQIPHERVLRALRLFAERVIPRLR